MNAFAWLDSAFCVRLAETLGHFLWQGVLVAVVTVSAAALLRRALAE